MNESSTGPAIAQILTFQAPGSQRWPRPGPPGTAYLQAKLCSFSSSGVSSSFPPLSLLCSVLFHVCANWLPPVTQVSAKRLFLKESSLAPNCKETPYLSPSQSNFFSFISLPAWIAYFFLTLNNISLNEYNSLFSSFIQ